MMPAIIRTIPTTFGAVIVSWKSKALKTKTSTNDRLINGYAKLSSNFVIAAIHERPARRAASKPVRTNGSNNNPVRKSAFFVKSTGSEPARLTRHFTINCAYEVSTMVQKTRASEVKLLIVSTHLSAGDHRQPEIRVIKKSL